MKKLIVSLLSVLVLGLTASAQDFAIRKATVEEAQAAVAAQKDAVNPVYTFCKKGEKFSQTIARPRGASARLAYEEAIAFERLNGANYAGVCVLWEDALEGEGKEVKEVEPPYTPPTPVRETPPPAPAAPAPQPSGAKSFVLNLLNGINLNLSGGYAQEYAQPVYLERETYIPRMVRAAYYPQQREYCPPPVRDYCPPQHVSRWTGGGGSYQPRTSSRSPSVVNNNTNTNTLRSSTTVYVNQHKAPTQSTAQRIAASTRAPGRPTFAAGDRSHQPRLTSAPRSSSRSSR